MCSGHFQATRLHERVLAALGGSVLHAAKPLPAHSSNITSVQLRDFSMQLRSSFAQRCLYVVHIPHRLNVQGL